MTVSTTCLALRWERAGIRGLRLAPTVWGAAPHPLLIVFARPRSAGVVLRVTAWASVASCCSQNPDMRRYHGAQPLSEAMSVRCAGLVCSHTVRTMPSPLVGSLVPEVCGLEVLALRSC